MQHGLDAAAPPPEPSPPRLPPQRVLDLPHPPRRLMLAEVGVAVAVGVLPDLHAAVASFLLPAVEPPGYAFDAAWITVRTIAVGAVILYIIGRSPEGWTGFGLRRFRPVRDTAIGLAIALGCFAAYFAISEVMWSMPGLADVYDQTAPLDATMAFEPPETALDVVSVIVMSVATATGEELVICALLVTRLHILTRSAPASILLASALFASYHVYHGVWAMPILLTHAITLTTIFYFTRRLWPIVAAHAIYDMATFLLFT